MEEQKIYPILYKAKAECCGCTACYAVCPTKSIEMKCDEEGFLYPQINLATCIRCNRCINICPIKSGIGIKE